MTSMIKISWPPKELNPNSRTHWSVKARAIKTHRSEAAWEAHNSVGKILNNGDIELRITFRPPDNRRRDIDNMLASCKGMLDGIADGLKVNDSRFKLHLSIGDVLKGGAVLVEVNQ